MEETLSILYQAGYKYRLAVDAVFLTDLRPEKAVDTPFIVLTLDGALTLKEGYAWDGPSGPTLDTPTAMRASLFHDGGYNLARDGHLPGEKNRRKIDRGFYERLQADGMWEIRAKVWYRSVRRWAKNSSIQGRPILEAP